MIITIISILLHQSLINQRQKILLQDFDIDGLVEKIDFNDKLKNLNNKVLSNKIKHVEAEKN